MDATGSGFSFSQAPPSPSPDPRPPEEPPADNLRTCRICFDTEGPDDPPNPELGRLISPCRCRGSSRYVHAMCLQQWRTLAASRTAFYQCPTCKYRYRFRRLKLASFLGSKALQFALTISILLFCMWCLGFISEPIISSYLDFPESVENVAGRGGWGEHFLRGFASLGMLGFLKVLYLLGPSTWWNFRNSVFGGRERVARLSWIVVVIGVVNFFIWLWKKVGEFVRAWMDKAVTDVLDVGVEEDGEDGFLGNSDNKRTHMYRSLLFLLPILVGVPVLWWLK